MAKRRRNFRRNHSGCTRIGLHVLVGICMGWTVYNKTKNKHVLMIKAGKPTRFIPEPTILHLQRNRFISLSDDFKTFEITTDGFNLAYDRMSKSGVKMKNYTKDEIQI